MKNRKNLIYVIAVSCIFISYFGIACTTVYGDCQLITEYTYNWLDCLFAGDIGHFYDYNNCMGSFFGLIPTAIWHLPLWILKKLGLTFYMQVYYMWTKILGMLLIYACSIVGWKIVEVSTKQKDKIIDGQNRGWYVILLCASSEVIMSVGYAGQNEFVYYFTFLLAFYYWYIEKNRLFWFFSVCSTTLCPIMLMPILVMILLKEKRILLAGIKCLCLLIPQLLFEVVFKTNEGYIRVKNAQGYIGSIDMLCNLMNQNTVEVAGGISLAAVIVLIVYWKVYITTDNVKEEAVKYTCIILMIYTIFMQDNFYRQFLHVPFLLILIFVYSGGQLTQNMLLLSVLNFTRLLNLLYSNKWQTMNYCYMVPNPITNIIEKCVGVESESLGYNSLFSLLEKEGWMIDDLMKIVNALSMAIFVVLLCSCIGKNRLFQQQMGKRLKISTSILLYCAAFPIILLLSWIGMKLY